MRKRFFSFFLKRKGAAHFKFLCSDGQKSTGLLLQKNSPGRICAIIWSILKLSQFIGMNGWIYFHIQWIVFISVNNLTWRKVITDMEILSQIMKKTPTVKIHNRVYALHLLLLEHNLHGFIWPADGILEHTSVIPESQLITSGNVEIKAILFHLMFSFLLLET